MRNTFFRLWVHGILKVAEDSVCISPDLEPMFYIEIEKRLIEQGCEVAAVGGRSDHVHVLFTQNPLLSLHETMRFLQGISQRWYHLHDFDTGYYKFHWDAGYTAYSFSESLRLRLIDFVENQETIHEKVGYYQEMQRLNELHNVDTTDEEIQAEIAASKGKYELWQFAPIWEL